MYNILIRLGDLEQCYHGIYQEFHLECNYNSIDIDNAYLKASEILGIDFINTVCINSDIISSDIVTKLNSKYSIIPKSCINSYGEVEYVDYEIFIDIYFNIIKIILPDIVYKERNLEEDIIHTIDGSGLGLYYL